MGHVRVIHEPSQLDFERPGKRTYEVAFHLDGEWGHVLVPLTVIIGRSGSGKTVACFGGTHGDEYEGQVAGRRLIHELDADEMRGRVLVIPRLNPPACEARTRSSPLDGGNMNRAFPGDPQGTITYRIADFVSRHVLPKADAVIDWHAGGAPMDFAPLTSFRPLADSQPTMETLTVARQFDTPFVLLYSSDIAGGLLVEEAERQGKIAVGGEFGHGAGVSRIGVRFAYEGACNALRYYGILPGDFRKVDTERQAPPRLVQALAVEDYVPAPLTGVFEPAAALGQRVEAGGLIGRLHDFERPTLEPMEMRAPHEGYLIMHRFAAPVHKGDTLFVVAGEVSEETLEHLSGPAMRRME